MSQQALPYTPPPPQTIKGGFIFSHMCLEPPKLFPKKKVDFVRVSVSEIKHKKRVFYVFLLKLNFHQFLIYIIHI